MINYENCTFTTDMVTAETPEFKTFLAKCQELLDRSRKEMFPNCSREILVAIEAEKFIKIAKQLESNPLLGRSVYCFVAKVDSETKALGKVTRGDVLKAASWLKPAKHARSNIFLSSGMMDWMTWTGTVYLNNR